MASAVDRALRIHELLEKILLLVVLKPIHDEQINFRSPIVDYYPFVRVCRYWKETIESSWQLQRRITEPMPILTAAAATGSLMATSRLWTMSPPLPKPGQPTTDAPRVTLADFIIQLGPKIDRAWWQERRNRQRPRGSWRNIQIVLEGSKPLHIFWRLHKEKRSGRATATLSQIQQGQALGWWQVEFMVHRPTNLGHLFEVVEQLRTEFERRGRAESVIFEMRGNSILRYDMA